MSIATRVYLGRISYDVRERDIEKFFKGYGRIREIVLKESFAFVEFDDKRDAEDAVYDLNNKDLLGQRVQVEFARGHGRGGRGGGGRFGFGSAGRYGGPSRNSFGSHDGYVENRFGPPRNTEFRVLVENLSSRISWQDLKDFMRKAGEVTYADAHKRERNTGIVDFATYSDMKAALEKFDGYELNGRRLRLREDKSRRRRSGSRSRSRSPPRQKASRSRSRSRWHSRRSRSESEGRSKSRSKSPARGRSFGTGGDQAKSPASSRSRSRSRSPAHGTDGNEKNGAGDHGSRSRSESPQRSRFGSPQRSRSRSPANKSDRGDSRSRSRSPMSHDSEQNE